MAKPLELGEGTVDGTGAALVHLVEGALGEPHVEVGTRLMAGLANPVKHDAVARLAHPGDPLILVGVHEAVTLGLGELKKSLGAAYKDRMRRTASSADSRDPNAVRRKYPSPLGPNPEPGVPTTCTVSSSRLKNCHDDMPSGTASHR